MLELLGSVLGAIAGASIAQAIGSSDHIVVAAIAGSFVGGSVATALRRSQGPGASRPP